jgi:hypothetical protein
LAEASVVIDGSKFKAVNNRDKNFTRAKMERRVAQIVARYLQQLDIADRQEPSAPLKAKTGRLKEKIETLKEEMRRLEALKTQMLATTDRSMATSGRGSGVVGYNVQVAVETKHHLIITHEVTNVGTDRSQLAHMAKAAKATLQVENLDAVADRGGVPSITDFPVAPLPLGGRSKADDPGACRSCAPKPHEGISARGT